MQKIDECKKMRLALTRAGIATRPEKCLQTFRLVVTAQYIYHKTFSFVVAYHFLVAQNYFVSKPQKKFSATIRNAARCVRYNERVGQRSFRTKSQSHSLERSISTQHVSSILE
jgi:hypothetical protein